MMKKLFVSLVAMMVATVCFSQNTLVATLSHGDEITMYYGAYALRDAYNAAASGDIINLSGGAFQAVNITKGIILRGTGIDVVSPTYISGNFYIEIPTEDTNRLSMEGIRCTGTITMKGNYNSPYFVKSQFYGFSYDNTATIKNVMFADCKITNSYKSGGANTTQFINCYVGGFNNINQSNTAALFLNCVILPESNGSYPSYICLSQLINCIVYRSGSGSLSSSLSSSTIATNCISIGYSNLFGAQPANTNNKKSDFSELFKDFTGYYSDSQTFELTDEAKTTFLGNDGTEVGLYGGILPYNSTPSYPQITKMNVANKTTADGKLSVEIEVSATE